MLLLVIRHGLQFRLSFGIVVLLALIPGLNSHTLHGFRGDNQPRMTPEAPVINFLYPRFSEDGYTQWILRGAKAHYDNEEQIRVDGMHMRLFTGDERMALEMEMKSPEATIRLRENRAFSDTTIHVEGTRFNLSGDGWTWIGNERKIEILRNAAVSFMDALPDTLGATALASTPDTPTMSMESLSTTRIRSHKMTLLSTETHHHFSFEDTVDVRSRNWLLNSQYLEASIAVPEEGVALDPGLDLTGNLNHAIAREKVRIIQFDRTAVAAEAEFFPLEDRVVLRGRPRVQLPGAFVAGSVIHLQNGEVLISGSETDGRAQLVLRETGGLGIQGNASLGSETIVLADQIHLSEDANGNRFVFQGRVAVLSGDLEMDAGRLTVYTNRNGPTAASPETVSTVQKLIAEQAVRIDQAGQTAEAEHVIFFPLEERALLSGKPRLFSGNSEVRADIIELRPGLSLARSEIGSDPVIVTLPDLPDLGYREPQTSSAQQPAIPTQIKSRSARMETDATETRFIFTDAVEVTATNLQLKSDSLQVFATPDSDKAPVTDSPHAGPALQIERINAVGAVEINQKDRSASAGKAVFLPKEGRVILEMQPQVAQSGGGKVTGHRIVLMQNQRRAIVEGGPDGERARITLPPFSR
jgi:lipopolysaccharide export system protein LptA